MTSCCRQTIEESGVLLPLFLVNGAKRDLTCKYASSQGLKLGPGMVLQLCVVVSGGRVHERCVLAWRSSSALNFRIIKTVILIYLQIATSCFFAWQDEVKDMAALDASTAYDSVAFLGLSSHPPGTGSGSTSRHLRHTW